MIKKLLMGAFGYTLILGVIAVALYTILGINITYISFNSNYGLGMWIYDYSKYIQDLQINMSSLTNVNILQIPTTPNLHWDTVINSIISVGNAILIGLNYIIFAFNAILSLAKLIFYVVIIIMSVLGLNTQEIYIYDVAINFYNISIPYIPYLTY